jgi:hypothetical protein
MVIANYVAPSDEKKYAKRKLKDARTVIRRFPILKSIANNFRPLAHLLVRNNKNSLFMIASSSTPKDPVLIDLEKALRLFRFETWKRQPRNDFAGRLQSPREDNSWSPFCEMNVALRLQQRYGKDNVDLYPSLPGSDIVAKIHDREICFEVTAVFPGKTEETLKKICRGIAKGLHSRIKDTQRYFRLEIQTGNLPKNRQGQFRIRQSIDKVLRSFDELGLVTLVPIFGNFHLQQASDYIVHSILPEKLFLSYTKGLDRGFRSKRFKSFIKLLDQDALKTSPIRYFVTGKANYLIAEVGCESIYPTQPAKDEQEAFLDRLQRRILTKLSKPGQIILGKPNILVVNGTNWTIHGYDFSSNVFEREIEFAPVKNTIRRVLLQNRPPNLSAIMIYENDFRNARIVANRFARKESRLSAYEGMSLFTKKRITQLRRLKQSTRIRAKIIPSKLAAVGPSIIAGYKRYSLIADIASTRTFDTSSDANVPFFEVQRSFKAPKAWLRDPQFSPDFGETGRMVGIVEIAYLVKRLLEDSEHVSLQDLNYDTLCDTINKFSSQVGPPTMLFVPLTLHLPIHNWIGLNPNRRIMKWKDGQTILLLESGLEIPIHWLTNTDPHSHIIIYKKKDHGQWIVRPGNASRELTVQIVTRSKEDLKVIVKTVVAYVTLNKNAAWCLSFDLGSIERMS